MSKNIPTKVNNYNVYNDGEKLLGVGDELTLPDFEATSETISGFNICAAPTGPGGHAPTGRGGNYFPMAFRTASPRPAGLSATMIPAFFMASIFDSASPLPPETIAPA